MRKIDLDKPATVYWIRFPSHTDPFTQGYIGFTTQKIEARFRRHVQAATARRSGSPMLCRILRRRGFENVMVESLLVAPASYCLEIENKLRPTPHIGWNLCAGGGANALGIKRSESTKAKLQAAKVGRPRSEETKAKLREALKGNKCAAGSVRTAEFRAAARAARIGKPRGTKLS